MKTVKDSYTTLENLVAELDRQRKSKIDFVADLRTMDVQVQDKSLVLVPKAHNNGQLVQPQLGDFLPTKGIVVPVKTLKQLASRLDVDVPPKFLEKLDGAHRDLLRNLLSDLMTRTEKSVLVRCLDDQVRATLSDRYRVMDNHDLAFAALDVVRENKGQILTSYLGEDRFTMKFTTQELWEDFNENIKKHGKGSHEFVNLTGRDGGEKTFNPLVTLSNSETGRGGLNVRFGIFDSYCVNMAIIEKVAAERHLGSTMDSGLLSQEAIDADAKAIMLKVRDMITAGFHPATFARIMKTVTASTEVEIKNPTTAVENVVDANDLSEEAKGSILEHFLSDYDATAFGLSSAVSRYAQEVDAEYSEDLQELAGAIMTKPAKYATA